MNMKKIIHEELGQELENIGFHYVSGERLFWPYEREKDGIKQEIMVVRDRYEKGYIRVIFATNAYGQREKEFCDFVPEEGAKHWDFWGFDNEEEFRDVLKEFKRLIFTYGLDFLETISKPATDAVPTREMQKYLYEHHQELFEKYQEELGTERKSAEEVIEIITGKIEEMLDKPYTEVKDALIGFAALYGHTICWGDRGDWVWDDERGICEIQKILGTRVNEYILNQVIADWDYWRKYRDKKTRRLSMIYERIIRLYCIDHPEERS
ncbi:MAG: hypothetical protein NC302_04900 [Bacteroidales bacterium]|nr:hypothetical protein [Bacteroidales bacterium]MCM1416360.1 hypothetical protein [bacterium]MCM1422635.1 hypothetical protein [bacterium]